MRPQTPRCPGPDTGPRQRWQHRFGSAATSTLVGDPHHSATDPVINPGNDAMVRAKFAYGTVSKDLEGEDASLWLQMRPCGRWAEVDQQRTNHAGRAAFAVPAALIARVGAYPFQLVVRGDLTRAHGTIFVVAEGTQAVAFDVDGTLTTGDSELIEQIALGNDPEVRPGASATVRLYAEAGYLPIYITGRPYMLRKSSRDWLRRHGFPPGVMITTDRLRDSRPSRDAIGRFKRSALLALIEGSHLDIVSAYGNAGTDICAYAEAGIDPRSTYIVGKHRGQHCGGYVATQPIYDYREHARTLAAMPRAK
jgi:phosphatidate phosphatase PAH1